MKDGHLQDELQKNEVPMTPAAGPDARQTPALRRRSRSAGRASLLGGGTLLLTAAIGLAVWQHGARTASATVAPPPPPTVTISRPLQQVAAPRTGFLGQFSAVDRVELRAQVGGTLTEIHFSDGQIVHKGQLLFVIDPRPYEIRLAQAVAQVETAAARLALTRSELWRAQQLKRTDFGTAQTVDQRLADQHEAEASVATAQAAVRDAQLDLDYCRITAPFTGRISSRQVSIGSLISGSRAGTSQTTLLTTLVSLDPIYLDFDMSENDYLSFARARTGARPDAAPPGVDVGLGDETHFTRHGRLDFVDNALNRGSGTIHARASLRNQDLFLMPGEFARLSLTTGAPASVLLVPTDAVMLDQSQEMVMTVSRDGHVVPKPVETGPLVHGLRVIRAGLGPEDRVVINGLMQAQPGGVVSPRSGVIRPAGGVDE